MWPFLWRSTDGATAPSGIPKLAKFPHEVPPETTLEVGDQNSSDEDAVDDVGGEKEAEGDEVATHGVNGEDANRERPPTGEGLMIQPRFEYRLLDAIRVKETSSIGDLYNAIQDKFKLRTGPFGWKLFQDPAKPLHPEDVLKDVLKPNAKGQLIIEVELPGLDLPLFKRAFAHRYFPRAGPSRLLLQRSHLLEPLLDKVLNPRQKHINSIYVQGPSGSGKTALLELLGRRLLEEEGVLVFHLRGNQFRWPRRGTWVDLINAAERSQQKIVVLIDDAHKCFDAYEWSCLLSPGVDLPNFSVVAFGSKQCSQPLFGFNAKFPMQNMFLRQGTVFRHLGRVVADARLCFSLSHPLLLGEFSEFIDYWARRHDAIPKNVIEEVASSVCDFTGGHFFPFVNIVNYLFEDADKMKWNKLSVERFLASHKFLKSHVHQSIMSRCFEYLPLPGRISSKWLFGQDIPLAYSPFIDLGLWYPKTKSFCSALLVQHLFQRVTASYATQCDAKLVLDDKQDCWLANVAKVIELGLSQMELEDFAEGEHPTNEDALGFRWAFRAQSAARSVFISPPLGTSKKRQVAHITDEQLEEDGKAHQQQKALDPRKLDVALELMHDDSESAIEERFRKFDEEFLLQPCSPQHAVFHFQRKGKELKYRREGKPIADRLFTFVKETNSLYWGSKLHRPNVVRAMRVARFVTFARALSRIR